MRRNYKEVLYLIGFHCLVLLRGFMKAVYGTATAAMIAAAVYGFRVIPTEGGYAAVGDFMAAIACIVGALAAMYAFGYRRKHR